MLSLLSTAVLSFVISHGGLPGVAHSLSQAPQPVVMMGIEETMARSVHKSSHKVHAMPSATLLTSAEPRRMMSFLNPEKPASAPTAEEVLEYCRDPDSSGCDIDMLDKLRAEANTVIAARSPEPTVWSEDIDSAVKANAPQM